MNERNDRLNEGIPMCAKYLATASVDVIVYACTGGSFYKGRGYDRELYQQLQEISGAAPVVTALACVEALRWLSVHKVMIITPYPDEPGDETELLQAYLEEYEFQVVARVGKGLGRATNLEIGNEMPMAIHEFVLENWNPRADGLLLSCTDWRALEVAQQLEQDIGKPVVTSNQATIWQTLRVLDEVGGIRAMAVDGCGMLLKGLGSSAH